MPEFIYAGQVPTCYTELRDATGAIVGTVQHGDSRQFTDDGERPEGAPPSWPAPDGRWVPGGAMVPAPASEHDAPEPQDNAGLAPEGHDTEAVAHLDGTSGEEQ